MRISTADQPEIGGRCTRKKTGTRPKKRPGLPNYWAVQAGGRPSRRFGFQGITDAHAVLHLGGELGDGDRRLDVGKDRTRVGVR